MKFERGYSTLHAKMEKSAKFTMSCTNCDYYYQASGDKEEVCQHISVLEYDMVVDGGRIYCSMWRQLGHEEREEKRSKSSKFDRFLGKKIIKKGLKI